MKTSNPITDGQALKAARLACDLARADFGAAVGLQGSRRSRQVMVSQWESGATPIPHRVGLLAECLAQGARPSSWP